MSGGGTQKSLRKALGALKDTTTVSLAKVNSDYKVLKKIMHLTLIFLWKAGSIVDASDLFHGVFNS